MGYKIVIDSCGDLTEGLKRDSHIASVPLELDVDDYHVVDDESFDQAVFLQKVKESQKGPKSACPSPQRYYDSFVSDADRIYAVTLSSKLSGSYNSAVAAKQMFETDFPEKKVYVFDSRSASIGETLIGIYVQKMEEAGVGFEEVVKKTEDYIDSQQTFFVLESLETLRKNGRLSNLKAFVASVLNIKPLMGSNPDGSICQMGQARGINKALDLMVQEILKKNGAEKGKTLAIAHCNCPKRAQRVREQLEEMSLFGEILVVDTAGVSSMYANDGGVIAVV